MTSRWATLDEPFDLAWPMAFDGGPCPDAFSLPPPRAAPVVVGEFVGSIAQGASVNCDVLQLSPHGSGTHTECVGHIIDAPVAVGEVAPVGLLWARLLRVQTEGLGASGESYAGRSDPDDEVVSARRLAEAWSEIVFDAPTPLRALAVRVCSARFVAQGPPSFSGQNPPYFSREAMAWICERLPDDGALLTDLPSIDREDDGGTTPNHRMFWAGADGAPDPTSRRTITELCRLDAAPAGSGWIVLGVAPFLRDAAPSRPIFFPTDAATSPAAG